MEDYSVKTTTNLSSAIKHALGLEQTLFVLLLWIAQNGDRCDQLSQQFYGTPEHWWFIATVNKLSTNHIEAGTQIRIPVSLEEAEMT